MKKTAYQITFLVVALLLSVGIFYWYKKTHSAYSRWGALYEQGLKPVYDKRNFYCPEARVAYFDSCLRMVSPEGNLSTILGRSEWQSLSLLQAGDEKRAVEILTSVMGRMNLNPGNEMTLDLKKALALAYLRLGERNNCVNMHGAGSCIFPIRDQGVYNDPAASLKAIRLLTETLEYDTADIQDRWLLNLAYMTVGGYPDRVPARFLIPGLDKDTSSVQVKPFRDLSPALGLNSFRNEAGGSIVDDFNNDGYLDIVTSSLDLKQSMHYFRNNGDGSFTDMSEASGLSSIKGGLNIIQADYNNDGYTDILVLRGGWMQEYGLQPKTLLRNNGDGTFTDVTLESGLISLHPSQTGVWADFNNDGWLDLYIGNETSSYDHLHPSQLFLNNQDGTFSDVSAVTGASVTGFVKGVVAADYNKDGWPDLFLSMLDGRKILLRNMGTKSGSLKFTNATHEAGLDRDVTYTFPTAFMDYDNDGWPDIFVCGYKFNGSLSGTAAKEALNRSLGQNPSGMYMYHNNHDGTFTNVSKEMGLDHPVFGMGFNFGDIDNDGWLDIYIGTGNPDFQSLIPNRLFKNVDGHRFADVTRSARVGNLQKGHGVAFADIDNDGDEDIFVETGGAVPGDAYYNSLYINPGQNNNEWIDIQLEGVNSNRSAIGANIAVSFTEDGVKRTVYRDVNSGGSFGSSPFRKEIGIGRAKMIDELIVKWPTSGIVQVFKNITPCQFLKIKEGSDELMKVKPRQLSFSDRPATPMIGCAPLK